MHRKKEITYYFLENRYLLLTSPSSKTLLLKHAVSNREHNFSNPPLSKLYSLPLPEQLPVLMDPVKDNEWHLV
jgi:hypothetical protein